MKLLQKLLRRRLRAAALAAALAGLCSGAAWLVAAQPPQAPGSPARARLLPRLVAGDVLRYEIEFQTESNTRHGGDVLDPQGPARLIITWNATIRLEVLADAGRVAAPPAASAGAAAQAPGGAAAPATRQTPKQAAAAPLRVRVTYEKSVATVQSDSPDPQKDAIEQQYAKLAGQSIEFTLTADRRVADVRGLEAIITDAQARDAAKQWMGQLLGANSTPPTVAYGQHWSFEQPATSVPLAGWAWRSDSSYLRDEPCHPDQPSQLSSQGGSDLCAVVLTQVSLVKSHAPHNPTPDDYRRKGLRTSGIWMGSSQGLSYVSLKNGWIVSSTQDGMEQMDVTVNNPVGLTLQYAGSVHSRTSMSLVPQGAP